jgi:ankyrin repeat protein
LNGRNLGLWLISTLIWIFVGYWFWLMMPTTFLIWVMEQPDWLGYLGLWFYRGWEWLVGGLILVVPRLAIELGRKYDIRAMWAYLLGGILMAVITLFLAQVPKVGNQHHTLAAAVQEGNLKKIRALLFPLAGRYGVFGYYRDGSRLLRAGIDANVADDGGVTPLMYLSGNSDCMRQLIQAGAEVNAVDNDGATALMYAARTGNPEAVKLLLQAGAKVNTTNQEGQTALIDAAKRLSVAKAGRSLLKGQNYLSERQIAWIESAEARHVEVITVLLRAGAAVNAADNQGNTALMYAAEARQVEAIAALLRAGAAVNVADQQGNTLLMYVLGDPRFVENLIRFGTDSSILPPESEQ